MKLFPIIILAMALPVQAEVYKIVKPNGEVVYSDTPATAGDKPMNVPEVTTYSPVPLPKLEPVRDIEEVTAVYKAFEIESPLPEATIRDSVGNVEMLVTLEPGLIAKRGHRILYYLDGKPHGRRTVDTRKVFTGLDRGEHQLYAVIEDEDGNELIRTDMVKVFLHKASIKQRFHPKNPQNPNNAVSGS